MIAVLCLIIASCAICLICRPSTAFIILFPVVIFYPHILPQIEALGGMHGDDAILLIVLACTIFRKKRTLIIGSVSKWVLGLLILQLFGLINGYLMGHTTLFIGEALKTEFKLTRILIYALIICIGFNSRTEIIKLYFCLMITFFAAFFLMLIINLWPSLGLQWTWLRSSDVIRYSLSEEGTERYAGVLAGVWKAGVVGEVVTVFSVSAILGVQKIKSLGKWILYAVPSVAFLALVSSGTRTGSIVIAFAILMVLCFNVRNVFKFKYIFSLSIIGIVTSYAFNNISYTLLSRLGKTEAAYSVRQSIWLEVLQDAYPDGLMFGVGNAGLIHYSHSIYVWILAATGAIGLVYFLAMLIAVFRGISWMKKIEKFSWSSRQYNMRKALIVLIVCLAIHGLGDSFGYYARETIVIFSAMAYKWYRVHERTEISALSKTRIHL